MTELSKSKSNVETVLGTLQELKYKEQEIIINKKEQVERIGTFTNQLDVS